MKEIVVTDCGNIQIQDYSSDVSVKDPNYVNTIDYYFDYDNDSYQKQKLKKRKLTNVNQPIEPMISSVTDTSTNLITTPIESYKSILNYNDTQPSTSKPVNIQRVQGLLQTHSTVQNLAVQILKQKPCTLQKTKIPCHLMQIL